MFQIEGGKALEIVIRVGVIYLACMVLLRVAGRREMSELSPMDLLAMLLISETVSPALTGGDESVTGAVIAAATLFTLVVATGWIAFKSRTAERLIQGSAQILVENGRVRADVLRRHRITDDELRTTLHQHGVSHVAEVKRAYIEPDGEITIIRQRDHDEAQALIRSRTDAAGAAGAAGGGPAARV